MISVFETDDLDEAHDLLERTYARVRLSPGGAGRGLRLVRADLGPVGLHRLTFRMRFAAEVAPLGRVVVNRSLGGAITRHLGREGIVSVPGDLVLIPEPDREIRVHVREHDGDHAWLPAEFFAQVADAAPGPFRFTGARPVSAEAARAWSQAYDYVRDGVAGLSPEALPLLVGSAARLLAAATLSAFPNTALHDPTRADLHDAHPATLRRAVAFIDDNAGRDIAPADIAFAARVTIRALQLAFRRHLGTTPTAYLRRARLEQAHRQLLAADPATTTVSAVAMRWGFASHSAFTAHYRAEYGVAPSQTLRRR